MSQRVLHGSIFSLTELIETRLKFLVPVIARLQLRELTPLSKCRRGYHEDLTTTLWLGLRRHLVCITDGNRGSIITH